jgi:O-antigen/teichoic acid export membrane protein
MTADSLKKDYLWNTIGVLAQNAISPLLLIAVTRVNGIFESGLFSFAFSVAIIFWVVGMWGGRTYQVSDVSREFSHHSYVMVRLILAVFMIIGAFIFVAVNHYDAEKSGVIIALVIFKVAESIADAIHGVLQVHDRLYVVGKSLMYKALSGFGLFVIIDILTHNILLSCLGIILANVLLIVFYDLRVVRKLSTATIMPVYLKRTIESAINIMKRTWPVFIVVFLSMFSLNIPRYFIDMYHQGEIGYFGILAMPITLIGLVMTFILQPKVVHLSKLYEKKEYVTFNRAVDRIMFMTVGLGFTILLVAYVLGVPALELVFGIDFSQYQLSLLIIVTGGVINAAVSVFINIFTIIRSFKYQFYILLITNTLLLLLSASFVQQYGLEGGVTLFALINIVQVAALTVAYKMTLRRAINASN